MFTILFFMSKLILITTELLFLAIILVMSAFYLVHLLWLAESQRTRLTVTVSQIYVEIVLFE